MPLSEFQIFKVELLVQHKEAIARLYQLYEQCFPEQADLWQSLAREKNKQALFMMSKLQKVKAGQGDLNRERFQVEGIRASLNFINNQKQVASQQKPTLKAALSLASGTEEGIIEKKWHEVFLNQPAEFDNGLNELQNAAQPLLNQLKNLLFQYR
jgi:chromosome segregation ATPase